MNALACARVALRSGLSWSAGLLLASVALVALAACSDEIATAPADEGAVVARLGENADEFEYSIGERGGSLTSATISEPLTFNLALANDAGSGAVLGFLFEGLTETSWLTDEVEPALADSWDVSADGMTWTFYLRRDVRWHDGEPFTAADVDFTFNGIIYNEDIPTSTRAIFTFRFLDDSGAWQDAPMSVTVIDEYTVQFVLPVSFAPFLRSMGTAIYPEHILAPHVDDGSFVDTWSIDTDPAEIIGTGPFLIGSYRPGQRVVLRRNPDYWMTDGAGNRLPYLDEVVQIIVPDFETELQRFRAGETDVHGVLGEELAALEPLAAAEDFTIYRRGPNFVSTFLLFNLNRGSDSETGEPYVAPQQLKWFSNLQFRRAVAHVIDKGTIIDQVQHGVGHPQWASIGPAAGDFHNPNVRRYQFDLERANELLDELGWTDRDGDGVREDDEGNAITFRLVTNGDNSVRERVTAIIHEGMLAIGLDVTFELADFGELVGQLTSSYDWEAMVIGLTGGTDPYSGIHVWHSSESLHLWYPGQAQPATAWEAEIDELYVLGSQELDREQRLAHYHRAQEIIAENLPLIFTTHPERVTAVRNVFGNTTPTLYGLWDIRYLYRSDR